MGYYIRVLSLSDALPALGELQSAAHPGKLEVEEGTPDSWESLLLTSESAEPIALIERNPVEADSLAADEISEFLDEVADLKPISGAAWLSEYLPRVKAIYAFQFLGGSESEDGSQLLQKVYAALWKFGEGILQADGEGFSNEEGHTIVWQFSDHVSGDWSVGVVGPDGQWSNYVMDLGNPIHREAFWRGEVPAGIVPI